MKSFRFSCGAVAASIATLLLCSATPRAVAQSAIQNVIEIDGDCADATPGSAPTDWSVIAAMGLGAPNVTSFQGLAKDFFNCHTDDIYGIGSKDIKFMAENKCVSQSPPDKNDIENAGAAKLHDPITDHDVLAFFGDRFSNNGDAQIGFWFFQNDVHCTADGSFSGEKAENDLLVLAHYVNGGNAQELAVYMWRPGPAGNESGSTDCDLGSNLVLIVCETNATLTDPRASAATNGSSLSGCAGTTCPGTCTQAQPAPWLFKPKGGGACGTYADREYFEGAIDLTMVYGAGNVPCFQTFLFETRASQSPTAELKDLLVGQFGTCPGIRGHKFERQPQPECLLPTAGSCTTFPFVNGNPDGTPSAMSGIPNWEIRLFEDLNNNNIADANELVNTNGLGGALTNPVCTNSTGSYEFLNLRPNRSYIVCEVIPPATPTIRWGDCEPVNGSGALQGHAASLADVSSSCPSGTAGAVDQGRCFNAFLLGNEDAADRNFSNFRITKCCNISGSVFCDSNGNHLIDPGDTALPAGTDFCVRISSSNGGKIVDPGSGLLVTSLTQVTGAPNAAHTYKFTVLSGFTYIVEEDVTGGLCGSTNNAAIWVPTSPLSGTVVVPITASGDTCPGPIFGHVTRPTVSSGPNVSFCFTPTDANACGDIISLVSTATLGGVPITLTNANAAAGVQRCGTVPLPGGPVCVTNTVTSVGGQTATTRFTLNVSSASSCP